MIASDNFRYTALCVNCSLCYVIHVKRRVVTTHKKYFYHYAVTRNPPKSKDEKALLGTSTTLRELGFRNRKSTRDNPLMTDFAIRFPVRDIARNSSAML